jgi:hypothetical protein
LLFSRRILRSLSADIRGVLRSVALTLLAVGLVLVPESAAAHPINVAYASVTIADDGVTIRLSVNLFELDLLLSLDRDGDALIDQHELDLSAERVVEYLSRHVAVTADGRARTLKSDVMHIAQGADGKQLLETTLLFPGAPAAAYSIRCDPLTDLGSDHRTLAKISRNGRTEQFVFQQGVAYLSAQQAFSAAFVQFLQLGVLHIFTGYDHILFLLGLLLATERLLDAVKIITAFTLAHSITLALAALDLVVLNAKLVEAGIALSIVYIAAENLLQKKSGRRWMVSFAFGLVHGFGFANVLREMDLQRSSLLASLLSFNIGVELGQLVIVILILPVLAMARRTHAFPIAMNCASVLILLQGLWWFYERALT